MGRLKKQQCKSTHPSRQSLRFVPRHLPSQGKALLRNRFLDFARNDIKTERIRYEQFEDGANFAQGVYPSYMTAQPSEHYRRSERLQPSAERRTPTSLRVIRTWDYCADSKALTASPI